MRGGARWRSGPMGESNALRRKPDARPWLDLPAEGFSGEVPGFPLAPTAVYEIRREGRRRVKVFDPAASLARQAQELSIWEDVWRKPQAVLWSRWGLEYQVAAYVRAFVESVEVGATAGLKTTVLRMSSEIGLSTDGMRSLRWRIEETG